MGGAERTSDAGYYKDEKNVKNHKILTRARLHCLTEKYQVFFILKGK